MNYKNLILIGTSHIASHSVESIKKAVAKEKPGIIAVELDNKRLQSLLHPGKPRLSMYMIRKVGIGGYIFALIGSWVQKKLGKSVGVAPGSDMLCAVQQAKKTKAKLALIDQDVEITLRRFSKHFKFKDKIHLLADILRGLFFRKREMKRLGLEKFDLNKVPPKTLIRKLIKELEKRYPGIYKVLIEERNVYMAARLKMIMDANPDTKILAVVGAGHAEDMMKIIKKMELPDVSYNFSYGK